jgi:hypothetical protein
VSNSFPVTFTGESNKLFWPIAIDRIFDNMFCSVLVFVLSDLSVPRRSYCAVQCSAVQCSAVQRSSVQCSAVQCPRLPSTSRIIDRLFCRNVEYPGIPQSACLLNIKGRMYPNKRSALTGPNQVEHGRGAENGQGAASFLSGLHPSSHPVHFGRHSHRFNAPSHWIFIGHGIPMYNITGAPITYHIITFVDEHRTHTDRSIYGPGPRGE